MKNRLTERDITRIVRRVVNEEEENPMPTPMDEGKRINLELKQELIDKFKRIFQEYEGNDRFDYCEVLSILYNALSEYYDGPYVRKKGWNPKQCRNYDKLNVVLKRN
jgi:hypothetical protein